MDTNQLHKATVMTIALVIERLFNSLEAGDLNACLEHAVQIERGAQLLASSLAKDNGLAESDVDTLRAELEKALADDRMDKVDTITLSLPDKPDNPRLN
jgi:hypothetical protein